MALIGYARVLTAEQNTPLSTDALRKAGVRPDLCGRHFGCQGRPAWSHGGIAYVRDGDALAVWRLD